MKPVLSLTPQPARRTEETLIRSCQATVQNLDDLVLAKELWFEFPQGVPMPQEKDSDAYLLASLLPAMSFGADIHVHGSVSRRLLANIEELQHVWAKWCPNLYRRVSIQVDAIRDEERCVHGAVCAFSGGADAQFTAYRHAKDLAGYAGQSLRAGVFVHGFDIPLADKNGFADASSKADEILGDLGLDLISVRTNLRECWDINWAHYSGTALAATLNNLKHVAGVGLVGSGESYDALVVPWGSHPIPDRLSGSGDFRIVHDGAGYNRSEKIKLLSTWPTGVRLLRVCWIGVDHGRNCGKCEKCMRTRLNFMLAGIAEPECFDTPLDRKDLASVALSSEPARAEWRLIREEMARSGLGAEFLPDVDRVLRRPASRWTRLFPLGSRRRALMKKMLGRAE